MKRVILCYKVTFQSISKGFANQLCIAQFAKKSRKHLSNGFANEVYNLVRFANRGENFAYMQTSSRLCIWDSQGIRSAT